MEIKSTYTNLVGEIYPIIYHDIDTTEGLDDIKISAVHGFCFVGDEMVIVFNGERKTWGAPGGAVEEGENIAEAIAREVLEETNMEIIRCVPIGYVDFFTPEEISRHLRFVCQVKPNGGFVRDPDGDITEIKLIDPNDYKKYFDWGEVGDRIMKRALELKRNFKM